jgi:hypothetical protein
MKSILFTIFISLYFFCFGQNAIQLDGLNDIVTVNYPGILGNNVRTVEAWIKTSSNYNPNTGGVQGVISDWGTFTNSNRSTFNVLFNNAIRFEVNGNGVNGTIPVNDGNWHHVAMVYDPTATLQVSLYVDGILDIAGNLTIPVNTLSTFVRIGQRVDGLHFFNGKIDEYRLWSVALTQAQIIANKDKELCHINDPNLKLYYTFNQGLASGTNTGQSIVHDWSPNQKDGTLTNFALMGSNSNWVTGATLSAGFTTATASETSCGIYTSPLSGQQFSSSGTYAINGLTQGGCDSLLTLNLTVTPTSLTSFNETSCGSFTWGQTGQTYNSTGIYYDTLIAQNGCDSVLKLNLTIVPISSQFSHVYSCTAYTWTQTGLTYNDSGLYTDTLTSVNGCDSIISIMLTVYPQDIVDIYETSCDAYFWPESNQLLTVSGVYTVQLQSVFGCDSTVNLHLQLNSSDTTVQNMSACAPVFWDQAGILMDSSGIYTHVLQNSTGCDSIIQMNFTLSSLTSTLSVDQSTGMLNAGPVGGMYTFLSCDNGSILFSGASPSFTITSNGLYSVVVELNGCVDTSSCVSFTSAGLKEVEKSSIQISPNPCEETLMIYGSNVNFSSVQIFDLLGEIIMEIEFNSVESYLMDVSNLLPGNYLITLKDSNEYLRFVKQ